MRPLNEPRRVRVEHERGVPVAVRDGRSGKRVVEILESWRIDDEWWRSTLSRSYHTVILEDGRVLTLYEDLVGGAWYVQG